MTTEISFGSTYRVPLKQLHINVAKKNQLRALTEEYGGISPSSGNGSVRFSVSEDDDSLIRKVLDKLGFKKYFVVPFHNVEKAQLDNALNYKGSFAPADDNLEPDYRNLGKIYDEFFDNKYDAGD